MAKVKEMRLSVQSMLILMLNNMGMDAPENIEEITDFIVQDVIETADPNEWNSGDVTIAFRRWIEAQAKQPDENVHEAKNIWSEIRADYEDDGYVLIDAYLTDDDNEMGSIIAKVNVKTEDIIYLDERAKTDMYAQEVIAECLNRIS